MRTLIITLLFAISAVSCNQGDVDELQAGDIVFVESQSSQSPYIKLGTMSKWTHCGVLVETPSGLKVLEASKTVKLTPFDTFIGRAKDGNWCVKRPEQRLKSPIYYRKYLGLKYDMEFKFDNGKMYCSELVWQIYKDQGIELCKPRKVSSFIMAGIPKVKRLMDSRDIDMDQEVVAPVDIYKAVK